MAEGGEGRLTKPQYVRLGLSMSSSNMETLALGFLDIEDVEIETLKDENRNNMEKFKRELLRKWAYRNQGPDQIKKLAALLYQSAEEFSLIDPRKVLQILRVTKEELDTARDETSLVQSLTEKKIQNEDELASLGAELKPYMEQAMKIEVAPWIRDYVTEMDNLYTELTLEELHDKPWGSKQRRLRGYREMFGAETQPLGGAGGAKVSRTSRTGAGVGGWAADISGSEVQTGSTCQEVPKSEAGSFGRTGSKRRFLVKGDPGMGKTTLAKKIGWDWAKGTFTAFSVVFFVFLKLVQPNDVIENVIIQQMPVLEGLGLNRQKLEYILERFSQSCLLILDGLDEHAVGQNQDVLKILRGQKFLRCNVLVTSRPHSTREIQQHFQTIVRVDGFTKKQAAKFAFKILQDKKKVLKVLEFKPENFLTAKYAYGYGSSLFHCPILLSFMCLLVREDNIDLSNTTISVGEIYTRMIRCLYKKFTIRKNIRYEHGKFVSVITNVGRLAFKTLVSGNPLLLRSDVIKEVGEHAFDYGLLIGHEDFRLIRDETADIFVTFPHRSIQEFLGAFFMVVSLDRGETLHDLFGSGCDNPVFMTKPLFLHFTLWLLYSKQTYFYFAHRVQARRALEEFGASRLKDFKELRVDVIETGFPAIDVIRAYHKYDQLQLAYFAGLLGKMEWISAVVLSQDDPIDWILTSVKPALPNINYIHVLQALDVTFREDSDTVITMQKIDPELLDLILSHMKLYTRNPVVHLTRSQKSAHVRFSLSALFLKFFKQLFLSSPWVLWQPGHQIPYCPCLTHLVLDNQAINDAVVHHLAVTARDKTLPILSHLGLVRCSGLEGKLATLFQSPWPEITHLNLYKTALGESDYQTLFSACISSEKVLLPKLSSLAFSLKGDRKTVKTFSLMEKPCSALINLQLDDFQGTAYSELMDAVKQGKLPNLKHLGQSVEQVDLSDFPLEHLQSLKGLSFQGIVGIDLSNLETLTKNIPGLTKVELRDIKGTCVPGKLSMLLSHTFPSLDNLILRNCGLDSLDMTSLTQASEQGRLPVLRHLDIGGNAQITLESLFSSSCFWNQLHSLDITGIGYGKDFSGTPHRPWCGLQSLVELTISGKMCLNRKLLGLTLPQLKTLRCSGTGLGFQRDADGSAVCLSELLSQPGQFPLLRTVCVPVNEVDWDRKIAIGPSKTKAYLVCEIPKAYTPLLDE